MRNVLCPRYTTCLENAVRQSLPDFDCAGCPHEHDHEPIPPDEHVRAAILLAAAFRPKIYQKYREDTAKRFAGPSRGRFQTVCGRRDLFPPFRKKSTQKCKGAE